MKNAIPVILFMLLFFQGFAQNASYAIRGKYTRPIKKEAVLAAKSMSDLSPGYPSTWVTDYISAEVKVMYEGQLLTVAGSNDVLNEKQKSILQTVDVGTDIIVDISYKYKNSVTGTMDTRQMHFVTTVVPEVEAAYPGGREKLTNYLEQKGIKTIAEKLSKQLLPTVIQFIVTEKGEISDAKVTTSSEVPEIDQALLKMLDKMPKWKPAENADGEKIKQQFEFVVGKAGC